MLSLLAGKFVGTLACVYLDKAFTSNKLARALDEQGVSMVGMQRTSGRPKTIPRGAENYWPFGARTKAEASEYVRGSRREAFTKLPAQSRLQYLKAELWLDAVWVTLLATTYFSAASTTVLRWTQAAFARLPLGCSATLARYAKMMGSVDRFNRALAGTMMAMGRCKQRYHRALFLGWLLPAVGVLNVMVIFLALWPKDDLEELKKSRRCPNLGFNRWFQQQLGEALIEYGTQLAKDKLGDVELRTELGVSPSFMPMDRQRRATGFQVHTFPESHQQLKSCYPKFGNSNLCARCYDLAERDGEMGRYHQDPERDPTEPNPWVRKMPKPWKEVNGKPQHNVPASRWGCSVCKVYLCKGCFRMEDEEGNMHPDAWDHRATSRGLRARCVPGE